MQRCITKLDAAERIKWAISHNCVRFTEHARLAMRDDDITTEDVMKSAQNFEILEEYSDAKPFPACLVLSHLDDGNPLHAVVALPSKEKVTTTDVISDTLIIIVTIYKPSASQWTDQGRRKRKE